MLTNIPSILCCDKFVALNAPIKFVATQLSKKLEGKLVKLEQFDQAKLKLVPLDVSSNGKLVKLLQPYHAILKLVPLDVSINGKLVKVLQ